MAEPARAVRPEPLDATCATCPNRGGEERPNRHNGIVQVECRSGPHPKMVALTYGCGHHPVRQRGRVAARMLEGLLAGGNRGPQLVREAVRYTDDLLRELGHVA